MIKLSQLRHAYPERTLYIDRQHGHPEYTFLHFFTSMKLTYNGRNIVTEPHSVIIFRPGTPQHFESDMPLVHDWIHFHGDLKPFLQNTNLKLDTLYYPSQTNFITELTRELETEFYNARANRDTLIQLKFQELLIKLDRTVSGESEPVFSTEITENFRRLRGEMFVSLQEKWPVERMAAKVGFSKSRFYNIYKSIYGVTPTADLIEARINSAKNMLLFTGKKIEDISYLLGSENTTHFIRQFKKWTGCSPAVYRKKQQS